MTAMTRHYKKPVLLIEFDENQPFSLQVQLHTHTVAMLQFIMLLQLTWSLEDFAMLIHFCTCDLSHLTAFTEAFLLSLYMSTLTLSEMTSLLLFAL